MYMEIPECYANQFPTRPDICFAVKELSRMLDSGGREVWAAGQHLLAYVHNTHHYAIRYTRPEYVACVVTVSRLTASVIYNASL